MTWCKLNVGLYKFIFINFEKIFIFRLEKVVSWDNISESTRILKSYMSYCKQKRNGTRLQANPSKTLCILEPPISNRWVDVWLDNDDVATALVKKLSNIIHLIYWGVTKDAFVPLKEISSMGRRNSIQYFALNLMALVVFT